MYPSKIVGMKSIKSVRKQLSPPPGVHVFRVLLTLCLSVVLSGCASLLAPSVEHQLTALRPGQYRLDPAHATLLFKIQHMGLSTFVGRFNEIAATLDFDPEQMDQTRLDALVTMASIDVNNTGLADSLRGSSWLQTDRFAQARYTTLAVQPLSDSRFSFTGNLEWRGISRPVVLEVEFHGGANNLLTGHYTLGFSAHGSFNRSDFGVDSYIPIVGDEVKIEVYAEFQRR